MQSLKPNKLLDARGNNCPMPVVMVAEAIKKIEIGEILELIADDKISNCNFPSYCRVTGHELISDSLDNGVYRIFIRPTK